MTIFKLLFVFLCFRMDKSFATKVNLSSPECLTNYSRDPRIVGGFDTDKSEIPYIVSLRFRGGHLCGATIINNKWILTAAHCLCNGFDEIIRSNFIKGVIGLHKISDFKSELIDNIGPSEVSFNRGVIHPNYTCTKTVNDIALLEMVHPIQFNKNVKPICFTDFESTETYENSMATVSGWGWTDENNSKGIRPDILQKASVKVWNNDLCQSSFISERKKNKIDKNQLCAGYENGGIDSCWVLYSGGPLVIDNKLIGIVSTGVGCARPGLPGIYTRVNQYLEWINYEISKS